MPTPTPGRFLVLRMLPLALGLLALGLLACGSDVAAPTPSRDASQLYWSLTLNHRAITLSTTAPHDTITLVATPRNGRGEPLEGLPAPTFSTTDLDWVSVSPEGVVRARARRNRVRVIARLHANNDTHADTAFINIVNNASPPVLASLSAQPVPPDSAKFAVGGGFNGEFLKLPVRALSELGTTISGLSVHFASSDTTIAKINRETGTVETRLPGTVEFYAAATAFGVTRTDTVPFRIGYPLVRQVYLEAQRRNGIPVAAFGEAPVVVAVGGGVVWVNQTGMKTDVTFDDPSHAVEHPAMCAQGLCGSGNIEPFGAPEDESDFMELFRFRAFNAPGTYTYRSTMHGTTGIVIVVDESGAAAARAGR